MKKLSIVLVENSPYTHNLVALLLAELQVDILRLNSDENVFLQIVVEQPDIIMLNLDAVNGNTALFNVISHNRATQAIPILAYTSRQSNYLSHLYYALPEQVFVVDELARLPQELHHVIEHHYHFLSEPELG